MPAIAVVCGLIVTALFALGVDTLMIKLQQRRLRSAVDWACKRTARHLPITRRSAEQFPIRLRNALLSSSLINSTNVSFTNVAITLPTMPANGLFSSTEFSTASRYILAPGAGTPMSAATPVATSYYQTQLFSHSLGKSAVNVFPPIGDQLRDANSVAGCVVEAQIASPFFIGTKVSVVVKSAFRSSVRGPGPNSGATPTVYCAGETPVAGEAERAGLTIAIGTELFTNGLDPRFRFVSSYGAAATPAFSAALQSKYDPLKIFLDTTSGQVRRFYKGMPEPYTASQAVSAQAADFSNTARTQLTTTQAARNPSDLKTEINSSTATTDRPSDEEEMLIACANPLTLVRNTFVSTIVELASRHGALRDSTEILSLNPVSMTSTTSSPPSTIVRFGQDLAARLYQIPFVFFRETSGYVDAFSTGTNRNLYSMLASQLRWCFHLYDSVGTQRYSEEPLVTDFNNTNYEPQAVYTATANSGRPEPYIFPNSTGNSPNVLRTGFVFPTPAPTIARSTPRPWSQTGAWCQKSGADSNACNAGVENLTAAEVVSALGSTQYCPDGNLTSGAILCAKPQAADATPNPKPFPDLAAFLRYARRDSSEVACGSKAINAPGFYPVAAPTLPLPMPSAAYGSAKNINSHILIVLHYVPATSGLGALFQSVAHVTSSSYNTTSLGFAAPRPITIAFFPPTCRDLSEGLTNLQAALGLVSGIMNFINSPETNPTLRILVFAPAQFLPSSGVSCPSGTGGASTELTAFQQYWTTLLTDENRNIVNIAETVFSNRLTRLELIN